MGTGGVQIGEDSNKECYTFPSQALPCSGSTGISQPYRKFSDQAPRGHCKNIIFF